MHREVDGAGEQRLLDLLGEQALAAGLRQRPVLDRVAGGADDLELDPLGARAHARRRAVAHLRACASASGLPRVPMRSRKVAAPRIAPPDLAMLRRSGGRRDRDHRDRAGFALAATSRSLARPDGEPGWWCSASRRPATRPRRRWSSGPRTGRGKILSNIVLSQVSEHAAFGGVVPEIAARAHVEALDLIIAKAMAEAGRTLRRHRRRRGRRRPRPDRRRHRRAHHRQGDRAGRREAADRGQPSRGARAHRPAHRRRRRSPIACSSPPAATPRSSPCAASATMCGSAPPSTTPSAKPSTRPRSCSASAIPAARRSRRRR